MTKECYYLHHKTICPVCYRFLLNHLPWELNSCYEKNKVWLNKILNINEQQKEMKE